MSSIVNMCRVHRVTLPRVMAALAVGVVALLAAAPAASARPKAAADDAIVASLLGHADKLSAILDKDIERPKQALASLDRYLRKQRKPMKKIVARLVVIAGELDDSDRSDLSSAILWSERTQRLVAAISTFVDKHGADPRYDKKISALLAEIEGEGTKLIGALLR